MLSSFSFSSDKQNDFDGCLNIIRNELKFLLEVEGKICSNISFSILLGSGVR